MDKYNIQYSKESVDDLRNIYAYICFNLPSPDNAVKKIEKIKKAVRTLDTFPNGHPTVEYEHWDELNIHRFPVDNYIVFNQIEEEQHQVNIFRIFYKGRNIR